MDELNDKQLQFCREFIIDLNATQAAIRAGYSANSASQQGSALLGNPKVAAKIAELKQERCQELKVDANYVLTRLHEIDQLDVLDILTEDLGFRPLSEWPKAWRISLSAIDIAEVQLNDDVSQVMKKVKWPDKVRNLELLGKHVNVKAFEKEISSPVTVTNIMPVPVADSTEQWEQAAKANQDGLLKRDS